jgi:hypothetical protein
MKRLNWLTAMVACIALLAGCASPYGPAAGRGGYKDTKIDDNTFAVRFDGNGKTSADMVWNYWIYRCAELTVQNGFQYFAQLRTEQPKTSGFDGSGDDWQMQKTKGSYHAPTYIYVPGGTSTIRTWHANATIKMFKPPLPADVNYALDAKIVMEMLKDYVSSEGTKPAPKRDELLERASLRGMTPS